MNPYRVIQQRFPVPEITAFDEVSVYTRDLALRLRNVMWDHYETNWVELSVLTPIAVVALDLPEPVDFAMGYFLGLLLNKKLVEVDETKQLYRVKS